MKCIGFVLCWRRVHIVVYRDDTQPVLTCNRDLRVRKHLCDCDVCKDAKESCGTLVRDSCMAPVIWVNLEMPVLIFYIRRASPWDWYHSAKDFFYRVEADSDTL